ncbi:MAG: c-type cytochrome, partial [Flavobacteriaceae bacterium]
MRRLLLALIVLMLAGAGAFWWLSAPQVLKAADIPSAVGDPERGEYAFYMAGCSSCHAAPGSDDRLSLAGGMEFATAFGTFRAPNISPDPDAGIGGWSTLQFVNAVMRGVSPKGDHYYPAFPYSSYQRMKIEDVVDLKAFMDTLPPVAKPAPGHDVPFPFNFRRGLGFWKLIYIDRMPFRPDPDLNDQQNRGAYLVEGPGHCNECHTPRSILGGLDYTRRLSGAPN